MGVKVYMLFKIDRYCQITLQKVAASYNFNMKV